MGARKTQGAINTRTAVLTTLLLVSAAGLALWHFEILPLRLRHDGLYGGEKQPCASEDAALIEKPRLYLPHVGKLKRGYVRVYRVVDGDTLVLTRGKSKQERIRLIGIDTDEIGTKKIDPESPGWKATQFVFRLLEKNGQVKLKYDEEREDRFRRTLAYVYLPDGRMLNELLLKQGHAKTLTIPPNIKHAVDFKKLEEKARRAGAGRWASRGEKR